MPAISCASAELLKCATEQTSLPDGAKLCVVSCLGGIFGMSGVLDSGAKSGLAGVLRSSPVRPNEIWRTGHEAGAQIAHSFGSLRVLVVVTTP